MSHDPAECDEQPKDRNGRAFASKRQVATALLFRRRRDCKIRNRQTTYHRDDSKACLNLGGSGGPRPVQVACANVQNIGLPLYTPHGASGPSRIAATSPAILHHTTMDSIVVMSPSWHSIHRGVSCLLACQRSTSERMHRAFLWPRPSTSAPGPGLTRCA